MFINFSVLYCELWEWERYSVTMSRSRVEEWLTRQWRSRDAGSCKVLVNVIAEPSPFNFFFLFCFSTQTRDWLRDKYTDFFPFQESGSMCFICLFSLASLFTVLPYIFCLHEFQNRAMAWAILLPTFFLTSCEKKASGMLETWVRRWLEAFIGS